jgi:4'-phosphopantetheinyl transferase EntD
VLPSDVDDQPRPTGLLAAVLPAQARGVEADATDWDAELFPEEAPMVARAIDRRRREVAAGRACARRALELLGSKAVALPADPHRVPRWPAGVVGSITHTHAFCAAAVAWQRDLRSLGLDAERAIRPPRDDVMRLIATSTEAAWLATLPEPERGVASALVFSAKEALYKCQFPLTREMLEFHDVELAVDQTAGFPGPTGEVRAHFRAGTAAHDLPPLAARYALAGDLVVTAAFLAA